MKRVIIKSVMLMLVFLTSTLSFAQKCKPAKKSKQTNGDMVQLYGGLVSKTGMWESEEAEHFIYIAQVENGTKGTSIVAIVNQPYKTKKDYQNAVHLNQENLKNSVLELELNGEKIIIPTTECKFKPPKHAYSPTYTVIFEGDISKSDIEKLQNFDLQRFRLILGGLPYERYFKKPNKQTAKIKKSFNCVTMENVFELKKKEAKEMDLNEVEKADYSTSINGKWNEQGSVGMLTEFNDGTVTISKKGVKVTDGTYKIVGNRIIITTDKGNSISEISMFLKDMLILKEKGVETTYERID